MCELDDFIDLNTNTTIETDDEHPDCEDIEMQEADEVEQRTQFVVKYSAKECFHSITINLQEENLLLYTAAELFNMQRPSVNTFTDSYQHNGLMAVSGKRDACLSDELESRIDRLFEPCYIG